jgi:hypothetical protein
MVSSIRTSGVKVPVIFMQNNGIGDKGISGIAGKVFG